MRIPAATLAATAAALVASGTLGAAAAEAPTTVAPRTVSVGGVSLLPLAQHATAQQATDVYRQAMAAAINDGQAKAQFLAEKAGATLGPVQSIVEGGGSIDCTGGDEVTGYAEYEGEQPDFSSGNQTVGPGRSLAAPVAAPSPPRVSKPTTKHKRKKHAHAKAASAGTCTLSADVSLVYALS